jgi:hypothetical protein
MGNYYSCTVGIGEKLAAGLTQYVLYVEKLRKCTVLRQEDVSLRRKLYVQN